MGSITSRHRVPQRRASPENAVSRLTSTTQLYGVFIVPFIQMIHDHLLTGSHNRLRRCVLELRFRSSNPKKLLAATAEVPADSTNRTEILTRLKSTERSACRRLDWGLFWDFLEERSTQVQKEFEKFKWELATEVNRGRLSVDLKMYPPPTKDAKMRLIRFQLDFE